jgi:hypothetical protein
MSLAQTLVQTLITNAVTGYVAMMYERSLYSLQIAPMGGGIYECEAAMSPAGEMGVEPTDIRDVIYLRVSCWLGGGKMVRTEVEPLAPH